MRGTDGNRGNSGEGDEALGMMRLEILMASSIFTIKYRSEVHLNVSDEGVLVLKLDLIGRGVISKVAVMHV